MHFRIIFVEGYFLLGKMPLFIIPLEYNKYYIIFVSCGESMFQLWLWNGPNLLNVLSIEFAVSCGKRSTRLADRFLLLKWSFKVKTTAPQDIPTISDTSTFRSAYNISKIFNLFRCVTGASAITTKFYWPHFFNWNWWFRGSIKYVKVFFCLISEFFSKNRAWYAHEIIYFSLSSNFTLWMDIEINLNDGASSKYWWLLMRAMTVFMLNDRIIKKSQTCWHTLIQTLTRIKITFLGFKCWEK